MALENLKSIFQETQKNREEDFISNNVTNVEDSQLTTLPRPTLDTLLRGRVYEQIRFSQDFKNTNLFVSPEHPPYENPLFRTQLFDPRAPFAKERTLYFNTNKSFNPATDPTDFSTAGNDLSPYIPLTELGGQFKENLSWENLYNANHSPKNNPTYKGKPAVNYGPNVDRSKLNIKKTTPRGGRGDEPYIISNIGNQGRDINSGGRFLPFKRAKTDGERIFKFLQTEEGIEFALRQNINIPIQNTVVNKNGSLVRTPQRFGVTYNPISSIAVQASRLTGNGVPTALVRKSGMDIVSDLVEGAGNLIGKKSKIGKKLNEIADLISPKEYTVNNLISGLPSFSITDTFTSGLIDPSITGVAQTLGQKIEQGVKNLLSGETAVTPVSAGDKMTLAGMIKGDSLQTGTGTTPVVGKVPSPNPADTIFMDIESEKNGMPFYFKDLRDNTYIFFRAFIEGLTENISPSYSPTNYIGRSEPVWVYERAEREITFTLKLVAQTRKELSKIYEKMNRLSSMCYPQYKNDNYGNRMKPPLAKLRYGELYGNKNNELMGYIKSLSYSIDQTSTYETGKNARVPRHVTATIGYQVIHNEVPNKNTKFYGFIGD